MCHRWTSACCVAGLSTDSVSISETRCHGFNHGFCCSSFAPISDPRNMLAANEMRVIHQRPNGKPQVLIASLMWVRRVRRPLIVCESLPNTNQGNSSWSSPIQNDAHCVPHRVYVVHLSSKLCESTVKVIGRLDNQQWTLFQPAAADGFERCWMKCLSSCRPQDDLDRATTVQWDGDKRRITKRDLRVSLSDSSTLRQDCKGGRKMRS